MNKKLYSILALLLTITLLFPTTVKANTTSLSVISKEIIYQDEHYTIEVTTIIEEEPCTTYATTQTKTVTKVSNVKNSFGSVVATYTLKGTFRYDGTSATCTNATYTTSTDSIFWSFENTTAYASGAKAIGSFTAKSLTNTISKTVTITCSNTGVIS